jgi:putative RecB family exonuclease
VTSAFSHSRLAALDDCPRRYRLRYVDRQPEAFQTIEAYLGTRVHETLQWLYLEREQGRTHGEDVAVERFRETWRQQLGPSVRVVTDDAPDRFAEDGAGMIRRHVRTTFADDRLETLQIEPKVRLTLQAPPGATTEYVGYVDRLARDRDTALLHVIDFKTSRSVPDSMEAAGTQVRAYGVALLEEHGGTEIALRYEYLRHGRALAETFPRSRSGEIADVLSARVARALEREQAGDFPARPSALCRWCGYRETCDASPYGPASSRCPACGSGLRLRLSSRSELAAWAAAPAGQGAGSAEVPA